MNPLKRKNMRVKIFKKVNVEKNINLRGSKDLFVVAV